MFMGASITYALIETADAIMDEHLFHNLLLQATTTPATIPRVILFHVIAGAIRPAPIAVTGCDNGR